MDKKIIIVIVLVSIIINSSIAAANINFKKTKNSNSITISNIQNLNFENVLISFPDDEGIHNPLTQYPIEWWYVNFHLNGELTGKNYGAFVAFFKFPEIRVFSISDINSQKMYSNIKYGINNGLQADSDKLNLIFDNDCFYNKIDEEGKLIPFEYRLEASGIAEEDNEIIKINVDMKSLKAPMLVGGDGFVDIGDGWSYYYILSKLIVNGNITLKGTTENVTGYAWIDHQWGNFMNNDFPNPTTLISVTYEWFSIKLDNFKEIMVGDTWSTSDNSFIGSFSNGLNLFSETNTLYLFENYNITQLEFWTEPSSGRIYAKKWKITEPSQNIDLIVKVDFDNQMLKIIPEGFYTLFPSCNFWEGSCSVYGTINGESVNGDAYVELTHSWEKRNRHQSNEHKIRLDLYLIQQIIAKKIRIFPNMFPLLQGILKL